MIENFTHTLQAEGNPYPGLRPFHIDEHHLFFGREGQSDEVLMKLSQHRFVAVLGPSGSGKSSFIYCGVLPILYGGFLAGNGPNWEVIVLRPGSAPLDNLADALLHCDEEYLRSATEEKKIKRTITTTLLRSTSLGIVEYIQQLKNSASGNYLILVDQFEELFRYKTSQGGADETLAFINLLAGAVNYPGVHIYVALTMRSDFIGECAQYPELTRKINDSNYLIPQMTREQKRAAIVGPAAVGHSRLSPRLVQQLLNDLGDNPDQLPILQHALMRTWDYWHKFRESHEEMIEVKHYEAIGTMREALSMHANEAYDELDEEQQHICEKLFKSITEKRGQNSGIRRPTKLSEIAAICHTSQKNVEVVIDKFREKERSLLTPSHAIALHGDSVIDISHESLMRIWTRLKGWVEDEADAAQTYLRLAEAATMHQVGKSGLWRPPDLQVALNWRTKHKPTLLWGVRYHPSYERTILFLDYSKKEFETEQRIKELEIQRKNRNKRLIISAMSILLAVALVGIVYAYIQQGVAQENAGRANDNARRADQEKETANSERRKAIENEKEAQRQAQMAKDNAQLANTQKELALQQKMRADDNATRATQNEEEAKLQKQEALTQKQIAERNENNAKIQATRAQQQRYRAMAKAMAIKSKELTDVAEQTILAQQAYKFNKENGGYPFDNDIYNGLYAALKKNNDPLTRSLEAHKNGAARTLATDLVSGAIYSGGSDGRIFKWLFKEGIWHATPVAAADRSSTYQVYSIAVSPNSKHMVAAGLTVLDNANNYAEIYSITAGKHEEPVKAYGFSGSVEDVCFLPGSHGFFARDNAGHSVKFCDLKKATEVIRLKDKITAIALSHDGESLLGVTDQGFLYIWQTSTYRARTETKISKDRLTAAAFAPDGRIVIGDVNGNVRVIEKDFSSTTFSGHSSQIDRIRFSYSGNFMATAGKDYQMRLWNLQSPNELPIVLNDHDWVWDIVFTPNDKQVMSAIHSVRVNVHDVDQTIKVYPTGVEQISDLLCGYATRNMTKKEWEYYVGSDIKPEITCPNIKAIAEKQ